MKRASLMFALFVVCTFSAATQVRAQNPLEAYPDTVAVVIRFESIGHFVGGVNDMLGAISPRVAEDSRDFEGDAIGAMLELRNRTDVVDRMAPVCVAIFPVEVGGPPSAILLKAKDETKLIRALLQLDDGDFQREKLENGFTKYSGGVPVFVGRWNDYYVITRKPEIADLMNLNGKDRRNMADVLNARARKVFDDGSAAVVVNTAHLATKFKSEIADGRTRVHSSIDDLPDEQLGTYAEVTKKVYHDMADMAFDALLDSTWFVGHVNLSAAGGQAEGLFGVKQDSKTDKLLAANKPSSMETLGLLPSGVPLYFGMAVNYERILGPWLRATYGQTADTPEARAAAEASAKLIGEAGVKSTVVSYALPGDGKGGITANTLQEAEHAGKLRDGMRKLMQAAGDVKSPLFNMSFEMKENAESYREHKIDLMEMKFKFLGEGELAVLSTFYEKIFGGDVFQTRSTTLDTLMVQATGNDASSIRKLIDAVSSGEGVIALDDAYGKSRDQLADQSNVMLLVDAPRMVVDGVKMLSSVEPFASGLRLAPFNFSVNPPASYSGLSVGAEPQGVRFKAFVPVEQPRGLFQIFQPGS